MELMLMILAACWVSAYIGYCIGFYQCGCKVATLKHHVVKTPGVI